jgi:hypothetical protein
MTKTFDLYPHQKEAISRMKPGGILCGDVGSGKSLTALGYYIEVCGGSIFTIESFTKPKNLYIITPAKKRDSLDWEKEIARLYLNAQEITITIDSWNNIKKYSEVENSFFILDEQRLVGTGVWVKSFYKIAKKNFWIMLSATPGDTWLDYIPVFVANGFFKNRTEFLRNHVVYSSFTKFPKIDRFLGVSKLETLKNDILVVMDFSARQTVRHNLMIITDYSDTNYKLVTRKRWNIFKNKPIENRSQWYYFARQVVNSDESRLNAIRKLLETHPKLIVFYNFNYELALLYRLRDEVELAEYNGKHHDPLPDSERWVYLVQYAAGSEAWNCVTTNAVVFYSLNYSYRVITQASGRIDRLDTPFKDLYYYFLVSKSPIDRAILSAVKKKKTFNEKKHFSTFAKIT